MITLFLSMPTASNSAQSKAGASSVRLPPAPAQRRQSLHAVQDAVDRERTNDTPVPLANYPVKMPLYSHQTRGANMALLTFGWVRPTGGAAQ